jgi:Fur family transcriptional regulator, ferric uptake regulator
MKDNYVEILKKNKLKVTPARVAILELFGQSNKPLSVDMIEHKIKSKTINQVTIYRTLESFCKLGIISRVDLRQGAMCYELVGEHHHHHIVCTECGILEDFESCQIEGLSKKIISKSTKFKLIKDHSFELFGVCNLCLKHV